LAATDIAINRLKVIPTVTTTQLLWGFFLSWSVDMKEWIRKEIERISKVVDEDIMALANDSTNEKLRNTGVPF